MAVTHRTTEHDLEALVRELEEKPHRFGFYQVLRLMECLYPEGPRLGASARPGDDPLRLGQPPSMKFEPASLASFKPGGSGKPHRLGVHVTGLFGPQGPLPLHFTEHAIGRQRDHGDPTFSAFLDLFHHRMLSLLYRAWANNEPTVSHDRPHADRFAGYVASLVGLGLTELRKRDDLDDHTKLFYCGRLSNQTKCADGLRGMVADYFGLPVRIEEFMGEWLCLPDRDVCRLGRDKNTGVLGESAMLGARVWSCQHRFRLVMGPLDRTDYERLLPTGDRLRRLVTLVRNYAGDEFSWDVKLILESDGVSSAGLDGKSRLGWNTWLGERDSAKQTEGLVLDAVNRVKS